MPLYLDMVEDARLHYDRGGFFRSVRDRSGETVVRIVEQVRGC